MSNRWENIELMPVERSDIGPPEDQAGAEALKEAGTGDGGQGEARRALVG